MGDFAALYAEFPCPCLDGVLGILKTVVILFKGVLFACLSYLKLLDARYGNSSSCLLPGSDISGRKLNKLSSYGIAMQLCIFRNNDKIFSL